jgi:hypothetical protein
MHLIKLNRQRWNDVKKRKHNTTQTGIDDGLSKTTRSSVNAKKSIVWSIVGRSWR